MKDGIGNRACSQIIAGRRRQRAGVGDHPVDGILTGQLHQGEAERAGDEEPADGLAGAWMRPWLPQSHIRDKEKIAQDTKIDVVEHGEPDGTGDRRQRERAQCPGDRAAAPSVIRSIPPGGRGPAASADVMVHLSSPPVRGGYTRLPAPRDSTGPAQDSSLHCPGCSMARRVAVLRVVARGDRRP